MFKKTKAARTHAPLSPKINQEDEVLTQDRLKELLHYDPETGVFTWLVKKSVHTGNGVLAGHLLSTGYIRIGIDRSDYFAHRLAWLYVYGEWPKYVIDHINGNSADNRIENLRDVSLLINRQNQRVSQSQSACGYLGVTPIGKKFRAAIKANGRHKFLGLYDDPQVAHEVYLKAKRELHEGCTL